MSTTSKFQDQTFLFTGTLTEFTREEAEALVTAHGGKVLSGLSGKLNYLVVGEDAGSKLEKAKALGTVKILTEKEFLKMVPKGVSKPTGKAPGKKVAAKVAVKSAAKATSTKKDTSSADPIAEVKIGNQIWMAKNLDVTHFRNGDPIPEASTNEAWVLAAEKGKPAWCNYENEEGNGKSYGKLYNWHAVNDSRGLAPIGWRLPINRDWIDLKEKLGKASGKFLKSTTGWEDDGNGNNKSGFNALPSGCRSEYGHFKSICLSAYWWCAGPDGLYNNSRVDSRGVSFNSDSLQNYADEKGNGFSVRCVKDKS